MAKTVAMTMCLGKISGKPEFNVYEAMGKYAGDRFRAWLAEIQKEERRRKKFATI